MATNNFNNNVTNNVNTLNTITKGAIFEAKEGAKSYMFNVNTLNKFARKNEYVEGVNIHELGVLIRNKTLDLGYTLKQGEFFSLYLFERGVNNQIGYTHTHKVKGGGMFAISEFITDFKAVKPTLIGFIQAYKDILKIDARQADKEAKEKNKEQRKAETKAKAEARKQLKKEQAEARKLFANGQMDALEFAVIMAKYIA